MDAFGWIDICDVGAVCMLLPCCGPNDHHYTRDHKHWAGNRVRIN